VHVLQGVQDFVPPDKCRLEVNLANIGTAAEREFVHDTFEEFLPCVQFLLRREQNGIVRYDEGASTVLAEIPLRLAFVPVLDDVFRMAMGAMRAISHSRVIVAKDKVYQVGEFLAVGRGIAHQAVKADLFQRVGQRLKHLYDYRYLVHYAASFVFPVPLNKIVAWKGY
jgi:hypothetical protein